MKSEQHTVFLSIGSNVGDKRKNLDNAVALMDAHDHFEVLGVSPYYKTQPQNFADQDWFVNAGVKIVTDLDPILLLDALKALEDKLDKDGKPFRFGPRVIDLDIVYFGSRVLKSSRLEIPHPRMHERCFVLVPLRDIGPETCHPLLGMTPDELLNQIEKQESQKVILLDKEA